MQTHLMYGRRFYSLACKAFRAFMEIWKNCSPFERTIQMRRSKKCCSVLSHEISMVHKKWCSIKFYPEINKWNVNFDDYSFHRLVSYDIGMDMIFATTNLYSVRIAIKCQLNYDRISKQNKNEGKSKNTLLRGTQRIPYTSHKYYLTIYCYCNRIYLIRYICNRYIEHKITRLQEKQIYKFNVSRCLARSLVRIFLDKINP